jgi:hypothetical protein
MKKSEFKKLIVEMIQEDGDLKEMARIASGYKLTDDWEEKWETLSDSTKKSTRFLRVVDYMKGKDSVLMKDIAQDQFNSTDTASVNPQLRTLLDAGVVEKTGLVSEPKKNQPKEPSADGRGRKKITDDAKKEMGIKIATKFAKASTETPAEFSEEEKQYIMDLYAMVAPKKKSTKKTEK